ncbi:MAG TPA: DUF1684 domain-containing protein [Acidimicrobiales bacterium]
MTTSDFQSQWAEWHQEIEARRRSPQGFLAVTGLYWLDIEPISIPGAPGRWALGENGPVVELDDDEHLVLGGDARRGRVDFGTFDGRHPVRARYGATEIEIARRGTTYIVRPRQADHQLLADYEGTPSYPPSPLWALTGEFLAREFPLEIEVGSTVDGLSSSYTSSGVVEFEVNGSTFRLTAFDDDDGLTFLFGDETSGTTTYPGGRELETRRPDAHGFVRLDFNRATNLPCAYTSFTTCPLPPPENRLALAVEAGEQIPARH